MKLTQFVLVSGSLLCLLAAPAQGRAAPPEVNEVTIIDVPRFDDSEVDIDIDGLVTEAIWAEVPAYDGMTITNPDIMGIPPYRTWVRYLYTDKGLYVGARFEQPPETLLARLTGRDTFVTRDEFGVTLDTSGQGLYGYWFNVSLGGAVKDGKVAPERQFSNQWDGPWHHASAAIADGWSAEMFLPWSMMAMPELDGVRELGFWTTRKVGYLDEQWTTPAIPFTDSRFMSVLGTMRFQDVHPSRQLSFFPFVSYTWDEIEEEDEYQAGLDIFWRPSTNSQLTATLNPDFGSVESDDVVVNLTAFETFFPEKRRFFVEGNEVFITTPRSAGGISNAGAGPRQARQTGPSFTTTLLNTRRIGGPPEFDLDDDVGLSDVEAGRPTELIGAAKATGQHGGWRYGVLAAFEDDVRRIGERTVEEGLAPVPVRLEQDGRDFGVARVLYETSGDGRLSAGYMGTLVKRPTNGDAVVHGIDAHVLSRSGRFTWDGQFILSDVDAQIGHGMLMDMQYSPDREWRHTLQLDYLDADVDISDLGSLRRNDLRAARYALTYVTSQNMTRLREKRWSVNAEYGENNDGHRVLALLSNQARWTFRSNSQIRTNLNFSPKTYDDRNSRDNETFRKKEQMMAAIGAGTDTTRPISASVGFNMATEDLGDWTQGYFAGVTLKPNDHFSLVFDVQYNRHRGWLLYQEDRDLHPDHDFTTYAAKVWQPRLAMDYFISARQQLRLTLQWAGIRATESEFWLVPTNPGDLLNVTKSDDEPTDDFTLSFLTAQLRYRWEIGPLSDLFVVYTRGTNLDNQIGAGFDDLLHDAFTEPDVATFVIKLRYRFGT